jgi:hypothetical protein
VGRGSELHGHFDDIAEVELTEIEVERDLIVIKLKLFFQQQLSSRGEEMHAGQGNYEALHQILNQYRYNASYLFMISLSLRKLSN